MKKVLGIIVLGVLCAGFVSVAPAQAAYPEGDSFLLFDLAGFPWECLTVSNDGKRARLSFAADRTPLTLVQDHTGPGRGSLSFSLRNKAYGGLVAAKDIHLDCNYSKLGNPRWIVVLGGVPQPAGSGIMSCTVTYRGFPGGGTLTDAHVGVDMGPNKCVTVFGRGAKRSTSIRLKDRLNLGK